MALAERKMRIMSDKKIGVLGGSGEIGKRCVNILTEKGYTVMASYRTRKPMENNENVYVQLDICNENEVLLVERSRFSMIQAVRSVRLLHHMPQLNS